MSWIKFSLFLALLSPRPYLRHKNQNPTAYLSRQIPAQLTWGEILFRSPFILGKTGKSCNTCHPNGATTGEVILLPNQVQPLKIPSLRGMRYLAPYGHDGRTHSLRDFTRELITQTFGGAELSEYDLSALVLYIRQFDFLPNPKLTAQGMLTGNATADEQAGEMVFAKSGCVTCHNPQTYFRDGKAWRLNGVKTLSPYSLENGIKTLTLLHARGPRYLHDGRSDFDGVLAEHIAQLGLTPETELIAKLRPYLAALLVEEKPTDERHLAERASELHSWLTILEHENHWSRAQTDLLLKTLQKNFAAFKADLKTAADQKIFTAYMSGLADLIREINEQFGPKSLDKIREFSASFGPKLRFLGTVQ